MTKYQLIQLLNSLTKAVSVEQPKKEYEVIKFEEFNNGHYMYQTNEPGNPIYFG